MFRVKPLPGAAAMLLSLVGCARPQLPDADSPPARLYRERCGGCHQPYDPHSLTAAMWRIQVAAMMPKMTEAGQPPLSQADQAVILAYLERNAGRQ
jgi:hypothetical protein